MKSEHEANRLIQQGLRKLQPAFYSLKVAEKYHAGISDFFIWGRRRCAALEVKLLRSLPSKDATPVLKHPFDGPQLTFLRSIKSTGSNAFGAVVTDYDRHIHLYDLSDIPKSGNWTRTEFEASLVSKLAPSFRLSDIEDLAIYVTG